MTKHTHTPIQNVLGIKKKKEMQHLRLQPRPTESESAL